MLGISYGELFLIIGATAALIGPKNLPMISRTAGRLAGRAIGYVQLARGQFDNVMQHSQASQVHKELQDTMAQLEAIRHEIRSISMINPGPLTRRMDNPEPTSAVSDNSVPQKLDEEHVPRNTIPRVSAVSSFFECSSTPSNATCLQSQAAAYERLAESSTRDTEKLNEQIGLLAVLPVSAESSGLLPNQKESCCSDLLIGIFLLLIQTSLLCCDFFFKQDEMAEINQQVTQVSCTLTSTQVVHKVIHPPRKGRVLLYGDHVTSTELFGRQGSREEQVRQQLDEQIRVNETQNQKHTDDIARLNASMKEMEMEMDARVEARVDALFEQRFAAEMAKMMQNRFPHQPPNQ